MGLTELIFRGPTPAQIGTLVLDASVQEKHIAKAAPTRHPVESDSGQQSDISDHIHVSPLSIQITGVISNTPTESAAFILNLFKGGSKDVVKDAHEELLSTILTGKIVTVVTTLKKYKNMVLAGVEVSRDASKGHALFFTATATQITLIALGEASLSARPTPLATKNGGKTKPKAEEVTSTTSVKSSAAFKLLPEGYLPTKP